jgi:hypothetical protein
VECWFSQPMPESRCFTNTRTRIEFQASSGAILGTICALMQQRFAALRYFTPRARDGFLAAILRSLLLCAIYKYPVLFLQNADCCL